MLGGGIAHCSRSWAPDSAVGLVQPGETLLSQICLALSLPRSSTSACRTNTLHGSSLRDRRVLF